MRTCVEVYRCLGLARKLRIEQNTALMLERFERAGYSADIAGPERKFGHALTKPRD